MPTYTFDGSNFQNGTFDSNTTEDNGDVRIQHNEGTTDTREETFVRHVSLTDGTSVDFEWWLRDVDTNNTLVHNSTTYNSQQDDAFTSYNIDIYDHETLEFEVYLIFDTSDGASEAEIWWEDFTGDTVVSATIDASQSVTSNSATSQKDYYDKLPYYDSGEYTTPTLSTDGDEQTREMTIDTVVNSNESIDAKLYNGNGDSLTKSLSDGSNTFDISSFPVASSLQLNFTFSNSSTDTTPRVESATIETTDVVHVEQNGSMQTVPVFVYDNQTNEWLSVDVKAYDAGNSTWVDS